LAWALFDATPKPSHCSRGLGSDHRDVAQSLNSFAFLTQLPFQVLVTADPSSSLLAQIPASPGEA